MLSDYIVAKKFFPIFSYRSLASRSQQDEVEYHYRHETMRGLSQQRMRIIIIRDKCEHHDFQPNYIIAPINLLSLRALFMSFHCLYSIKSY